MFEGKTVFTQIMTSVHDTQFDRIVRQYGGHYKVSSFSCWDQWLAMGFAQLSYRESLRDIESCLRTRADLYHLGFRSSISRSTLAEANLSRDWRIYHDLAHLLIRKARKLYAKDSTGFDITESIYAIDATTIDLCLSLFPWAKFRQTKAAIKLHTQLDLKGPIPVQIHITDGKSHEVNWLDQVQWEQGGIYLMDRGYLDFQRLFRITQAGATFVIRAKDNLAYARQESFPVSGEVKSDQRIGLINFYAKKDYPQSLRRVRIYDPEQKRFLVFLTNNFLLDAATISLLYKNRWKVELFFKWIKQHLRIKAFFGTSENAVHTQIWIAIATYLIVAIKKKELHVDKSLHEMLQKISVNLFEKVPLLQLLTQDHSPISSTHSDNQLIFNDL
jgi:Transposase DDE domain/Domain of unknown function (DUF4372)